MYCASPRKFCHAGSEHIFSRHNQPASIRFSRRCLLYVFIYFVFVIPRYYIRHANFASAQHPTPPVGLFRVSGTYLHRAGLMPLSLRFCARCLAARPGVETKTPERCSSVIINPPPPPGVFAVTCRGGSTRGSCHLLLLLCHER